MNDWTTLSIGLAPILLLFAEVPAPGQERVLRSGGAESVGLEPSRIRHAARLVEEETRAGRVLAGSILVARQGTIVLHESYGRLAPEPGAAPAGPDAVYLIASISKPITATALMLLVERGQVSLAEPVRRYLPEFTGGDRDAVRVQDLLTHVSGLPDMLPENVELRRAHAPLEEFVRRALTTPLLYAPRTGFAYQSMGLLLAAEIVERATKVPLRDFMRTELFVPLGMKRTSLGLGGRAIADTAWCQGAPSYETSADDTRRYGANSPYWRDMGHPWGGVHSSTGDLAVFLQLFLNEGVYGGARVLGARAVREMIANQNGPGTSPWGLGWALKRSRVWNHFGDLGSDRTFGHVGATGTVAWADPETGLLCVILTTRPAAEDGGSLLRRVSNAVHAAVTR